MWPSPRKLCGSRVTLLPLSHGHAAQLAQATERAPFLPKHCRVPVRHEMQSEISYLLERQADGLSLTFAVQTNDARLLGWVGFASIDRAHKKLEIGDLWLASQDQRLFVEMMVMLMTFAFDVAGANTIQMRSLTKDADHCARLTALGANQDGILRGDRIDKRGVPQDVAIYSITKAEWPIKNAALLSLLNE